MNKPNNVNKGSLSERISELSFVKAELELYLDTHPECRTAIDYYMQTTRALTPLIEEYESTVGPLTAGGVQSTEDWTWVRGAWPWQMGSKGEK